MTARTTRRLALIGVLLAAFVYVADRPPDQEPVVATAAPTAPSPPPPSAASNSAPPSLSAAPEALDAPPSTATSRVSSAWVAQTSALAGIPAPAVTAYADAVLSAPSSCRVGWTTLAGIGWVESQHGTVGGRVLGEDGRPSTPILGPALDGRAYGAVPASGFGTALHGDPRWEHAVGPMQFLPATWQIWGRDGDGDGLTDPEDLYDAAAATLAYLCADGGDLGTGPGWSAAIFAYNHSDAYVDQVYDAASTYAARTS